MHVFVYLLPTVYRKCFFTVYFLLRLQLTDFLPSGIKNCSFASDVCNFYRLSTLLQTSADCGSGRMRSVGGERDVLPAVHRRASQLRVRDGRYDVRERVPRRLQVRNTLFSLPFFTISGSLYFRRLAGTASGVKVLTGEVVDVIYGSF